MKLNKELLKELNESSRKDSKPQLIEGKEYLVWNNEESVYRYKFHHTHKGVNYFKSINIGLINDWRHYEEIKTKFTIEVEVEAETKEEAVNRVENAIVLCDDMKIK